MNELKEKALSLLIDVWQNGDYSKLPRLCRQDVKRHHDRYEANGIEQFRQAIEYYRAAFSDLKHDIIMVCNDGDVVTAVYRTTGTHTGHYGKIAPTGIRETVRTIDVFVFRGGLIADIFMSTDELGILIKLGVIKGLM